MGICNKIRLTVWRLNGQSVCFKSEVAVYGAVALDPFIDPRVVDWTGPGRAKDGVHHLLYVVLPFGKRGSSVLWLIGKW